MDPTLPPSPLFFQALPLNRKTSAALGPSECKTCTSVNISIFLKVFYSFFPQFFLDVDTKLQYKGEEASLGGATRNQFQEISRTFERIGDYSIK
jgi:hypothetical protein